MNSQPDAEATLSSRSYENSIPMSQVEGGCPKRNSQTIGDSKSQTRHSPTAGDDDAGRQKNEQLEEKDGFRKTDVFGVGDDNGGGGDPAEAADGGQMSSSMLRIDDVLSCDDEKDSDGVRIDANQLRHETTFPQQLMDAIDSEVKDGATIDGEPILDWGDDGASFLIRDKAMFEQSVMPRHFSAKCKFMSFVRKLYRQVTTHLFAFELSFYLFASCVFHLPLTFISSA
jgi:hypothetical protein